jgi:hypothetical protein
MTQRQTLSLNGEWRFWVDPKDALAPNSLNPRASRSIRVPAPWQVFDGLHDYSGTGWYQCTFKLTTRMIDGRAVILCFGAVDYAATVWVNGRKVGEHEGGYLPFELDLARAARPGKNIVTVRVVDALEDFPEVPHGKQSWYGPISGLWQDVWIESRPRKHLTSLRITPLGERVRVEAGLSRKPALRDRLVFEVFGPEGEPVASMSTSASTPMSTLEVPSPKLWDIDAPNLYTARATLIDANGANGANDTLSDTFGFRTIEAQDGKLWLNGRPVYMRGALDQDYYPETIYTPPSLEYIEGQFRQAKELGLNSLRIHIKVGDPRYYRAADKIGLLIWTEMPNWQRLTEATKRRAKDTFLGMVERDWNRPSIVIRSIINEAWGIELFNPDHRRWMSDTYDWLKALDPSRLVVDNSACYGNFHVVTDIDDMHVYYASPDHYQQFRDWAARLAERPVWTFAPQLNSVDEARRFLTDHWSADWITPAPENRRRGDEPIIVSEFGNWGLPDVARLKAAFGGKEPWWFETGLQHGEGQVYPHGVEDRFRLYHLERAFPTLSDLARASQRMEYAALKWELEEMRRHAAIQGYVITEFTDLHWECNGLLDMARNPKVFHDAFAEINADDVIVPLWSRVAYWEGERVDVALRISQYSRRDLAGGRIEWSVQGMRLGGVIEGVAPRQAGVVDAGEISFSAPEVKRSTRARLNLRLVGPDGRVAARNHLDLYFFPRDSARATTRAAIFAPAHADALRALGYAIADDIAAAQVVLTDTLTEDLRQHLLRGGRVLWLAEGDDAEQTRLMGLNGAHVGPRKGTLWSGDWAGNFNWLCQDAMFEDIPTGGLVDFAFADLTPEHVIHGVHPYHFATDVHSGLFVGWIHKVVALIAERNIGQGRLLISTYRIGRHLSTHPVAAILVRDMLARISRNRIP